MELSQRILSVVEPALGVVEVGGGEKELKVEVEMEEEAAEDAGEEEAEGVRGKALLTNVVVGAVSSYIRN